MLMFLYSTFKYNADQYNSTTHSHTDNEEYEYKVSKSRLKAILRKNYDHLTITYPPLH